jgi:hypothetical protein
VMVSSVWAIDTPTIYLKLLAASKRLVKGSIQSSAASDIRLHAQLSVKFTLGVGMVRASLVTAVSTLNCHLDY